MAKKVFLNCKNCQRATPHERPSTSHLLHLVLSIVTAGFWIPVWFIVAMNNRGRGQCTVCGREVGVFGSSRGGVKGMSPTPDTHVKCPDCAELIKREARVCKHCGCKLVPLRS